MSLTLNVQNRYGTQFLVNITNPADPSATTIDTTRLSNSCTDTEADFKIYAGTTYDDTDARHVTVAVDGVIAKLAIRTGTGGNYARATHEEYLERLRHLALVTGRDRVAPKTDSILQPSTEQVGDEVVRPEFDWRRFTDLIPGGPAPGTDWDHS
tara:strand:- start:2979 stop:3440 length:462 start_codon:yes stop_codon:yes gene_type:complete